MYRIFICHFACSNAVACALIMLRGSFLTDITDSEIRTVLDKACQRSVFNLDNVSCCVVSGAGAACTGTLLSRTKLVGSATTSSTSRDLTDHYEDSTFPSISRHNLGAHYDRKDVGVNVDAAVRAVLEGDDVAAGEKVCEFFYGDPALQGDRAHSTVPTVLASFGYDEQYEGLDTGLLRIGPPSVHRTKGGRCMLPETIEMPALSTFVRRVQACCQLMPATYRRSPCSESFAGVLNWAEQVYVKQATVCNERSIKERLRDGVMHWYVMARSMNRKKAEGLRNHKSGSVAKRRELLAASAMPGAHPHNSIHANMCWDRQGVEAATFVAMYHCERTPKELVIMRHYKYTDRSTRLLRSAWRWNEYSLMFCVGLYALRTCATVAKTPTVIDAVEYVLVQRKYALCAMLNVLAETWSARWFQDFCRCIADIGKYILNAGDVLPCESCSPWGEHYAWFIYTSLSIPSKADSMVYSDLHEYCRSTLGAANSWFTESVVFWIIGPHHRPHIELRWAVESEAVRAVDKSQARRTRKPRRHKKKPCAAADAADAPVDEKDAAHTCVRSAESVTPIAPTNVDTCSKGDGDPLCGNNVGVLTEACEKVSQLLWTDGGTSSGYSDCLRFWSEWGMAIVLCETCTEARQQQKLRQIEQRREMQREHGGTPDQDGSSVAGELVRAVCEYRSVASACCCERPDDAAHVLKLYSLREYVEKRLCEALAALSCGCGRAEAAKHKCLCVLLSTLSKVEKWHMRQMRKTKCPTVAQILSGNLVHMRSCFESTGHMWQMARSLLRSLNQTSALYTEDGDGVLAGTIAKRICL